LSIIYFGSSQETINSISGHYTLPPQIQNTEIVRCCFRTRMYTRGLALCTMLLVTIMYRIFPGLKVSCFILRRWSVYSKYMAFINQVLNQVWMVKMKDLVAKNQDIRCLKMFKISFSFENMNSLIVPG